ncbi:MAG: FHA domain-containing protein [Tepidisphaeraceae bacterium]
MSDDENKITISWADLRSRKVDQRLGQMQAVRRNRDYAQMKDAPAPAPKPFRNLWYNTLVYMSVFGFVGGLLAWTSGYLLHFRPAARLEAAEMMKGVADVRRAAAAARISPEEKTAMLDQLARDGRRNAYFLVHVNEALSEKEKQARIADIGARDRKKEFISNVLAFGVSGMLIALMLSIAEPAVSRNIPSAIINGSVGATMGLVGGVVVALFVERLYEALGGSDGMITSTRQILARVVQWAVVGLFLTLAPGLVMRNFKKFLIGAAGGVLGGIVGGLLFDTVGRLAGSDAASRFIGLCAIGLVAGLGSGLIENAARSGWLKVTHGLIAGKQFILYRNPTYIGSSPDNQIYLFKDPQVGRRHAAIHVVRGGFELEDLPLGAATLINGRPTARTRLKSGDQLQIGGTRFLFQEKQKTVMM